MENIRLQLPMFIFMLVEILLGIMMLINPTGFLHTVVIILGMVFIVIGVVQIIRYLRQKKEGIINSPTLIGAIISLIAGLICTVMSGFVMNLIMVLIIVIGVLLVVSGVIKIQSFIQMRQDNFPASPLQLVSAILSAVIGVVLIIRPFTSTDLLFRFFGVMMIIQAVIDLVAVISGTSKAGKM